MKKLSEKYHAIVGILPGVKKNITNEVALLEDVVEAMKQINWRAKTESLDKHLRNVVIDISDTALAKLELLKE